MTPAYSIKICGPAGSGILSSGLTLTKVAVRSGYYAYDYREYPSIIRGGHNVMQTVISPQPIAAPVLHTNLLIALDQASINLHHQEIPQGGGIIFDQQKNFDTDQVSDAVNIFPLPLAELVEQIGGSAVMKNTVALGATLALLGGDINIFKTYLDEIFAKKGEEVVSLNQQLAQVGYDYIHQHFSDNIPEVLTLRDQRPDQIVITANESITMGAIAAGLQFASIYPMTPTTNILHNLAPYQQQYGFIYKQPEDEISAINMAIGAAHAGARSLVATAGGGFCLMTEGYGLAGITETPVVIVVGMRGGPATGLPTWTEQGDLRFVLHAHQSEFPRIVLAPSDVEDAFHLTMQAFNLAEKYQTPVVLLTDKHILESHQSIKPFTYDDYQIDRGRLTFEPVEDYHRYAATADGISLRTVAGSGNFFVANSDEHDQDGYSSESSEDRITQMNKRMQKLVTCEQQDMAGPQRFGPEQADITIVSWGSNKGAILRALEEFNNVNYIHLTWMNPFPHFQLRDMLLQAKYILNIEANYSAQLAGLIKEKTGIDILAHLLKYDGRPIYPEEIVQTVQDILNSS